MPLRVATILLRHGTEKYSDPSQRIDEIFARQMPDVKRTTLIVDNALPESLVEDLGSGQTLIGGNNSCWEFSAWDKGIAWLGDDIWSYDFVHLATSAFHTLYVKYLERFDTGMLRAIARRPVCVGHVDCYNDPIRILSFHSQHWVRTSFFFIPPQELKLLGSLVSLRDAQKLFAATPEKPFSEDAPLSKNYQDYVVNWLTGGNIGQGVEWHSRFSLEPQSFAHFCRKALAILNEHLLSIRLRAQGTHVIDTTWLATELAQKNADSIDWNTGWRAQLAGRDTDPLTLSVSTG
jgi:hypothetical protein